MTATKCSDENAIPSILNIPKLYISALHRLSQGRDFYRCGKKFKSQSKVAEVHVRLAPRAAKLKAIF